MNAKRLMVMACAVALSTVGLVEGVAAAQAVPGSDRFHPMGAEQARALGIQMIAKSFGISAEAAASRINVEAHAPDLIARIRTQYADRLAGLYVEHEPTHRIVVRLTGSSPVQPEFYQFDNGHAGSDQLVVDYQVGAAHTFADLQKRFENGFAALKTRLPMLQSGYVDERTGQIVLEVVADKKTAASLAVAQRQLADNLFGASTRIVPMGRIVNHTPIKGSGHLSFVQSTLGGGVSLLCTGAFTVYDNSTPTKYGLLTAGHCQAASGSYTYQEADGGLFSTTLTHVARRFDADTDVGWAMISTNPADAVGSFYTGGTYGWRAQGTPLSKSGTAVGLSVCHYGAATTAGSCGTVATTAYNPGSICGPGLGIYTGTSMCNAVYVAVDSVACAPSDSGGGWFNFVAPANFRPAGVHKAGNTSSGRCVYSSIDDIFGSPLNLQTL